METRKERLEEIFQAVCTDFEVELREFNGESDHVHLLVNYPPKVRLSELVNSLKGVSSRCLKQEFPVISTFWSVRKSKRSELLRRVRRRRPCFGAESLHRGPRPASGRGALNPGLKAGVRRAF